MTDGRDAGRTVDVHPDVALVGDDGLPGVHAHPHAHGAGLAGPACAVRRSRHGVLGAREGDEERVPLRVDFDAAVPLECLTERPPMLEERVGVRVAQLREQAGRPLNVREEERDGPGRQALHPP